MSADIGYIPRNKGIDFRRRYFVQEELVADVYSGRKDDFDDTFLPAFGDDYMGNNHFRKIVHGQMCPDFLNDILRLF